VVSARGATIGELTTSVPQITSQSPAKTILRDGEKKARARVIGPSAINCKIIRTDDDRSDALD
jgi:hypothetical protein